LAHTGGDADLLRWAIHVLDPDGAQRTVIDDGMVNSKPAWTLDGEWLLFHRGGRGMHGWSLWKIRPDGSELTPLLADGPYTDEYPVNGLL
jgi:hypothetical protein